MKLRITIEDKTYDVEVEVLESEESVPEFRVFPASPPAFVPVASPEMTIPADRPSSAEASKTECRSPVTGMVVKVNVAPGQAVQSDEVVAVLESMKMELQINAPRAGVVKNVLVATGSSVKVNQILLEYEE